MRHVQTFGSKQLVPMTVHSGVCALTFQLQKHHAGRCVVTETVTLHISSPEWTTSRPAAGKLSVIAFSKSSLARSFMRFTEDCIRAINMCAYTWDTRKPLLGFSFLLLLSVQETHIVVCPEIITRMLKKPHLSLFHWSLMRKKQFLILDCR